MAAGADLAEVKVHTQVEGAALVIGLNAFKVHAQVHRRDVHQSGLLVIRHRHPVLATDQVRANVGRLAPHARTLDIACRLDRCAGLQVDARGPVDALDKRLGRHEFSVGALEHVEKSVAVGLHQHRRLLAFDRQVGEHEFVDTVVVPCVMGSELVVPGDLPGVGIQRQHRRGVQVAVLTDLGGVVAAHRCRPRRRVAGAVVDEVELRVVGADEPGRAATELARVALPGFAAFFTGTRHGVGAPHLLAGCLVERHE